MDIDVQITRWALRRGIRGRVLFKPNLFKIQHMHVDVLCIYNTTTPYNINRIDVDYWFKQFGSRSVQLDGSNIFGSNARHIEEIDIYVYVSKHMTSW